MESELQEGYVTGDPDSFGKVVEIHRERIYRVALAMTGNREEAEDVTQDVFLAAYRARASFRGEAAIGTWLYRIAVNASLDLLGRRRGGMLRSDWSEAEGSRQIGESPNGSASDPERGAASSMLGESIRRAMDRLTPRERAVFALRHFEDLALKDVASMLSIRVGTVKSLLFRAVMKMQKELSDYREE